MYIYNITFGIDPAVQTEFLDWLNKEFIPVSTSDKEYFTDSELFKVHSDDPASNSFALHLRAANLNDINLWYADHGSRLFDFIMKHWGGHVVFFTTTLSKHV